MTANVLSLMQSRYGSAIKLSSATNVTNALGALYGLINQYGATYNFGADGKAVPFGDGVVRSFGTQEYEFFLQDSFKWRRNFTVTYGLRYSVDTVPYERNGVEGIPVQPLSQFFADRVGGQAAGVPSAALSTAMITYNLGGPVNHGPGWFPRDNNNFAPRLALAYAPDGDGLLTRLLGKGSALRAGAGIVYDHYGTNMVTSFASSGSPGLSTTLSQPLNTDFTTSFRYNGSALPALPTSSASGFPYSPPTVIGGFTSFSGVSSDLKAPYSYVLNATYTGGPNCLEVPDGRSTNTIPISTSSVNPAAPITRSPSSTSSSAVSAPCSWTPERVERRRRRHAEADREVAQARQPRRHPARRGPTHAHGDHTAGDKVFDGLPNATLIPAAARRAEGFGIAKWPDQPGSIDLGNRVIDVLAIPGHQPAHVAYYDRKTAILHTGDHLYPGRLYCRFPR